MKILVHVLLFSATLAISEAHEIGKSMTTAAENFLSSLNDEQKAQAAFRFESKERENWGYIPRDRQGLPLKAMSAKQITLSRALLKSVLSDNGIRKTDTIIRLEEFLGETEGRPKFRDHQKYYLSIFGTPSLTEPWGWRFEGHHLSLNYTVIDGQVKSVTPSFFAANPAEIKIEHPLKGLRLFHQEEDLARELAIALQNDKKSVVFSKKTPRDILTGEQRKFDQLKTVGVSVADFSEKQKTKLKQLLDVFIKRHREEIATPQIQKIWQKMEQIHFGWAGGLERGKPYYYRLQAAGFLIEVANVQKHGNHFHSVWRDARNDFGRDLLRNHVSDQH